ncbi:MAG TPA: hypothetical protein VI793_21040 [Anaerolineales bacterium]|nr:hypothetical protein [Anaerolineales bacterium]
MANRLVTKEDILRVLESLPSDSLAEVQLFAEFLLSRVMDQAAPPRRLAQLGGLWKGLPPITEADIAEARREMWGRFARA